MGFGESILRYFAFLIIIMTAFITNATHSWANSKSSGNPKYASIVMDAETGMILSQRYADATRHPASLTKVMTLLLVFDALERGDLNLRDRIRISSRAASMVPSKLGLPAGSSIRVEDAIYALVTKSANDIAVAVAEHLGGTESKFARAMTDRSKAIGMNATRFMNASGLHDKYQVTTARDMAKMAQYIIKRYPKYYTYFKTRDFTYKGKTYRNHNRLLGNYRGMDGFKTGYINASGFNLIASAERDGRRIIGVVFGGRSGASRNEHMVNILDTGFSKASNIRLAKAVYVPTPKHKPIFGIAEGKPGSFNNPSNVGFTSLASLDSTTRIVTSQQAGANDQNAVTTDEIIPNYTALSNALTSAEFQRLIGEGDFDPGVSKRLETGLIAVSVHKGDYQSIKPAMAQNSQTQENQIIEGIANGVAAIEPKAGTPSTAPVQNASFDPNHFDSREWSIQIGAFGSRLATDQKLYKAQSMLPQNLANQVKAVAVPLRTAEGMVFRARLTGLSQDQAKQACAYFANCLPIAPLNR
ncbi:MAG: D-alanyl-D-alanine carboxypeptidase [Alphaproteobacteria bacterium]|nr:D-alanyl-D-alanine carboxypeptidase [Alphaproteobacteria bacterium]NCQ88367.1 D-alanyl-D-alanine carboxypeptidase [Alphaproteobacteria bacterium]NCT05910.1 D-alanyl-D-alanine carboxypeptidase [Alphaproteobacteria bacterium]